MYTKRWEVWVEGGRLSRVELLYDASGGGVRQRILLDPDARMAFYRTWATDELDAYRAVTEYLAGETTS